MTRGGVELQRDARPLWNKSDSEVIVFKAEFTRGRSVGESSELAVVDCGLHEIIGQREGRDFRGWHPIDAYQAQ